MMLGYILMILMVILFVIIISKEGRPPSPGAMLVGLMLSAGTVLAQSPDLSKHRVTSDYFVKPSQNNTQRMFVDHNRSGMFVKFPNQVKPVSSNRGAIFIQSNQNKTFVTVYRPTSNYTQGSYNVRNVIKFK